MPRASEPSARLRVSYKLLLLSHAVSSSQAHAASPPDAPDSGLTPSRKRPALLFTAFEPSGDDHASAVIAELKARHPDLIIFAWGGPKMERAGATIIERTGDDAVMGMPGLAKIREHQRINERIDAWLAANKTSDTPVVLHIPVDSPAANTPICKIAKSHGLRVVHLVAPQIWAWGRWRIRTLRQVTDLVLCMLPFEERFFTRRRVPARFIGHFIFDHPIDAFEVQRRADKLPQGDPKLALFPGSRPDELRRNFPLLLSMFRALRSSHPGAVGVVACTNERVEKQLRESASLLGGWPDHLSTVVADSDAVIRWCDLALVKSGTVTLQVARQCRPMVIFYKKGNPVYYNIVRIILATKLFALPNLIAGRRIVPEFVPHWGGPERIIAEAARLLDHPDQADRQRQDLAKLIEPFRGKSARVLAANAIEEFANIIVPPAS
jgi:lipid-A-disaccharide synthase